MIGGIVGILGTASRGDVGAMAARLAHRGNAVAIEPVGSAGWLGVVSDDPGSRLVVVEGDGLACDGRVYDAGDALARLSSALHEGGRALEAVDGDYALARIDAAAGTVTLARDYFGSRPLYCTRTPAGAVAFGSEYKALLALPGIVPEPDADMLQHLQHAKRLPLGRTLLRNVWSTPPGSVVTLDRGGAVVGEHRFAPLEAPGDITDIEAACTLIRERFEAAARRRTPGREPLGLALSGGIDSIALAFLFRRLHPDRPLLTFTAGSHEQDHECVTARRVAKAVGAVHHEVITPASGLRQRLPGLVWHLEDPYSRSESFQLYELARAAAGAGVRVLHHAQGADGMFAGMPKYGLCALMQRYPMARRALGEFYTYTQLGLPPKALLARLAVRAKFGSSVPPVPRVIGGKAPEPPGFPEPGPQFINRAIARGFQAGVCQDVQKFERPFAAFGIEARSVNYDLAYVRAAFTIDDALKIRDGQQKWIFRKAMEPWVPAEYRAIPKFPQRMEANLDLARALDALADDVLGPGAVAQRGIFEGRTIAALRRRKPSKPYSHEGGMRVWTAILTELWARTFLDRCGAPPAEAIAHG